MANPVRVAAFVDGFNLYHAIDELRAHHLKWNNLWSLTENFVDLKTQKLVAVYYCSAFATWLTDAYARHREYVAALKSFGVTTIMGRFKEKHRECRSCRSTWVGHEEKESDVNIAIRMVKEAYRDSYDTALLISADSDLAPAVRLVRADFPRKRIRILCPPERAHSKDLVDAAGGPDRASKIKRVHLERSLMPEQLTDANGSVIATRPAKYDPPPAPIKALP